MVDVKLLQSAILEKLSTIIDPETGADVVRLKLVEELLVESNGQITYSIRPSSPLCPVAVFLAVQIKKAVSDVIGVTSQTITVKDYVEAEALTDMINQMNV